jgi:hypothetical protein
VARMRYAGRYQSGSDAVDAADELDRPERGRWTVVIDRDDGPDFRFEAADDCGQGPPTLDERAVLIALDRVARPLRQCFEQAVAGERSIEALEMIWRLTIDARGTTTIAFADPGVDIEGLFQGDLDRIRARWATCADGIARRLRLPPALHEVRIELRVEHGGELKITPPPFD